jgi:lipid II:glycine glycyltransferase (peptidoglycan interpeptide bridge formation enzyme)
VGATKKGKKLFAPTLLVWEALKVSKKRKMKYFDFIGVWDERTPRKNTEWKGFTKFKEGFGGKELYYPMISII